jgi:hypothetical protein
MSEPASDPIEQQEVVKEPKGPKKTGYVLLLLASILSLALCAGGTGSAAFSNKDTTECVTLWGYRQVCYAAQPGTAGDWGPICVGRQEPLQAASVFAIMSLDLILTTLIITIVALCGKPLKILSVVFGVVTATFICTTWGLVAFVATRDTCGTDIGGMLGAAWQYGPMFPLFVVSFIIMTLATFFNALY